MRHILVAASVLVAGLSWVGPATAQTCETVPMPSCVNYYAECYDLGGVLRAKRSREEVLDLLYDDRCVSHAYRVINKCDFTISYAIPHGETSALEDVYFHDVESGRFSHTSFQGKVGLASCCGDQTPECLE